MNVYTYIHVYIIIVLINLQHIVKWCNIIVLLFLWYYYFCVVCVCVCACAGLPIGTWLPMSKIKKINPLTVTEYNSRIFKLYVPQKLQINKAFISCDSLICKMFTTTWKTHSFVSNGAKIMTTKKSLLQNSW